MHAWDVCGCLASLVHRSCLVVWLCLSSALAPWFPCNTVLLQAFVLKKLQSQTAKKSVQYDQAGVLQAYVICNTFEGIRFGSTLEQTAGSRPTMSVYFMRGTQQSVRVMMFKHCMPTLLCYSFG